MDESGHWYSPDGVLVTDVPYAGKREGFRPPTLRDARKNGWLPSVTTIIALLDRPGLRAWRQARTIEIALAMPNPTPEEVMAEVDSYVEFAAAQGTKIHLGLAEHFAGHPLAIEPEIDEIVREFWPWYALSGLEVTRSEHPIVSPQGWAGTIDYVGTYFGEPAVVDFKTQEFEHEREALFYDEHALQLSGYAIGAGLQDHKRLSVIISRSNPGLVAFHDWSKDSKGNPLPNAIERWDAAFLALWDFWQHIKNYYPRRLFDVDDPD